MNADKVMNTVLVVTVTANIILLAVIGSWVAVFGWLVALGALLQNRAYMDMAKSLDDLIDELIKYINKLEE